MRNRRRRGVRGFKREILRLVNQERHRHDIPSVRFSKPLSVSARAKALDMVKFHYFSHDTPKGTWYRFLYKYAGDRWRTIGENIARGQDTAAQVFEEWMDSPDHRANILSYKFQLLGIGFARDGETEYWVQHFGTAG